jgi:hypothetical protein
MLEIKIIDLLSVLCVGFITIFLGGFFLYWYRKFFGPRADKDFSNWLFDFLTKPLNDTILFIATVVLTYLIGLIVGDLTERMSDSDNLHKGIILTEVKQMVGLKSTNKLREEVIFNEEAMKLTELGRSVLNTPDIVRLGNKLAATHFLEEIYSVDSLGAPLFDINTAWPKQLVSLRSNADSMDQFKQFVRQIYYGSKNWIFLNTQEPLQEIKSFQTRIDLSRSLILLLGISLQVYVLFVIGSLLVLLVRRLPLPCSAKSLVGQVYTVMLCFILGIVITKVCYYKCTGGYNNRAYGYFASSIQERYLEKPKVDEPVKNSQ